MSQITYQGKQRALIRVAESRIAALDAVNASREHASRCIKAMPVSPSVLKRIGVVAGAAASVAGVLAGLRRKKKTAEKSASKGTVPLLAFLLQTLTPIALPMLQRSLQNLAAKQTPASPGKLNDF